MVFIGFIFGLLYIGLQKVIIYIKQMPVKTALSLAVLQLLLGSMFVGSRNSMTFIR